MFLRCTGRFKDGKEHCYWNIVENKRTAGGCVVQRQGLHLGEINDSQQEGWGKTIEVFEYVQTLPEQMAIFKIIQTARGTARTGANDNLTVIPSDKTERIMTP